LKLRHVPTDEEIRERRKDEYLAAWPIEKQMEAHSEYAQGRPEKLRQMTADFAKIRANLPFSHGGG
jgi:hypothetical protein